VDLIGVSPLVVLTNGGFMVGQATLKVALSEMERTCSDNQDTFIPFAFDTFGFLSQML
jgi:hypothetical protein